MFLPKPLYYLTLTVSFLLAIVSYRFLFADTKMFYPDMINHIDHRNIAFIAHLTAAPAALIFGLLNLIERRKQNRPKMHRWVGRLYGLSILIGGISGLVLGLNAVGGTIAAAGFSILAILWILVTAQAVRYAMVSNIHLHRQWMIRSFALTFAAVTLRLYLVGFAGLGGMEYPQASVWVSWLCWVPNLLAAEWWIRRKPTANQAIT